MKPKGPKVQMLKPRLQTLKWEIAKPLTRSRTHRQKLYSSRRWREKTRPQKLARDPLCQRCAYIGMTKLAEAVDHWTELAEGGAEHDPANLVSLCKEHHDEKTAIYNSGGLLWSIVPSKPCEYTIG